MPLKRILFALFACAFVACSSNAQQNTASGGTTTITASRPGAVQVTTSISTLNSLVEGVGGDHVEVQNIVPIGASPETFEPTPQDIGKLANAQLLVINGAGLETWLIKMLQNSGNPNLKTVTASDGLTVKNDNPHLWMDPGNAQHYVDNIRDGLIAVDPAHAADYKANAIAYNKKLAALQQSIQSQIDTIPASQRYMIVFHNAWLYYNARFGITTLGFVERNPGQDPNPQQIANLIDLAKQHNVHAVFSEPEYSPKILQSIAAGAGVKIVENLYDDSIGDDPRVKDYISMLQYDTGIIVHSLK